MEKFESVNMPRRQHKSRQIIQDEDEGGETTVKTFSLENVADHFYHRNKKTIGEFDDDTFDDQGRKQKDNRSQLAVLPCDTDDDKQLTGDEMEDWLKKLHIRTQHLVGKVTLNGISRLAATHHVATALTRFKGKCHIDAGKGESKEDIASIIKTDPSFSQSEKRPTRTVNTSIPTGFQFNASPMTESACDLNTLEVIEKAIPIMDTAVRSKKIIHPSMTEHKVPKRKEVSSGPKLVVDRRPIRQPIRIHPPIPHTSAKSADGIRKTNKLEMVKSTRTKTSLNGG